MNAREQYQGYRFIFSSDVKEEDVAKAEKIKKARLIDKAKFKSKESIELSNIEIHNLAAEKLGMAVVVKEKWLTFFRIHDKTRKHRSA